MAPVDDQRDTWVIAVSYNKARPLQLPDLKLISVIWQLQLEYVRHASVQDHLRETLFGVVRCLSTAIDAKDPYTCGHSERVARISVRLGQEMGLSRGEVSDLYLAGLLHDVGKIGIRDEVLLKSGPLAKDEYTHMKEHPITGDRIVSKIKRLSYLCAGVRSHHERYDGAGYPDGLAGESIPLMARIIAVADSCDAMMLARRYRPCCRPPRSKRSSGRGPARSGTRSSSNISWLAVRSFTRSASAGWDSRCTWPWNGPRDTMSRSAETNRTMARIRTIRAAGVRPIASHGLRAPPGDSSRRDRRRISPRLDLQTRSPAEMAPNHASA